jgi:hypothetical protein
MRHRQIEIVCLETVDDAIEAALTKKAVPA